MSDLTDRLKQAKQELKEKIKEGIPTLEGIERLFSTLGAGLTSGTFPGEGGEIAPGLEALPYQPGTCLRVYLQEELPQGLTLPATYRGIPLGYILSGESANLLGDSRIKKF